MRPSLKIVEHHHGLLVLCILCGTLAACDRDATRYASVDEGGSDYVPYEDSEPRIPSAHDWAYIEQKLTDVFCDSINNCPVSDAHEIMHAMSQSAGTCINYSVAGEVFTDGYDEGIAFGLLGSREPSSYVQEIREEVEPLIQKGTVLVDMALVEQCFEAQRNNCSHTGTRPSTIVTRLCREIFVGQVPDGQSCEDDLECSHDSTCGRLDLANEEMVCRPNVPTGEPCDPERGCVSDADTFGVCDYDDTDTCILEPRNPVLLEGESCADEDLTYYQNCDLGLFCGRNEDDALVCQRRPAPASLGEVCRGPQDIICDEGLYCAFPCRGEDCDDSPVCQALHPIQDTLGGRCGDEQWCNLISGLTCVQNVCHTAGGRYRLAKEGEVCLVDDDLKRGVCDVGLSCLSGRCRR